MFQSETTERRSQIGLILLAFLWMTLIAIQSICGPADGYVTAHIRAPGGMISIGPFIVNTLEPIVSSLATTLTLWLLYCLLIIVVPVASIRRIAKFVGGSAMSDAAGTRWICIIVVVILALLTFLDLPYLSNDIYLYRLHGQMLSQLSLSPYATAPSECLPKELAVNVPWANQNCPYGPMALVFFSLATSLTDNFVVQFWLLKIILCLPFLIMLLYAYHSRHFGEDRRIVWLAWIGLNPLLVFEICQNGHLEGWIGVILVFAGIALMDLSYLRVLGAGVLFGIACAVKLSVIVIAPIVLVWLLPFVQTKYRTFRNFLLLAALFVLPMLAVLACLYSPFWQGLNTFIGIQQESEKIMRSLYTILEYYFGVSQKWSVRISLLGNICACIVGMIVCWKRRSLVKGIFVCLLLQEVFGRTFLQPWHFCPLVMLAPLLVMTKNEIDNTWMIQSIGGSEMAILRFALVTSASVFVGGYVVLMLAFGHSPPIESLSVLCMLAPPLAVWIFDSMNSSSRLKHLAETE